MDEAQEILMNSLEQSGISLPIGVSSIQDLTPGALVSICAQSLHLIDDSLSFRTSLPASMAERFKLCTEIASSIKTLGYRGELSFHQFLYPSDEDSYNLVRFLVERLSRSSEGRGKEIWAKTSGGIVISDEFKGTLKDWIERVDNQGVEQSYHTLPFRTRSLKIRNLDDQLGKKATPLITRQVKPRSRIGPSVIEYNELRGLEAGIEGSSEAHVVEAFDCGSLEARLVPKEEDKCYIDKIFDLGSLDSSETHVHASIVGESEDEKNECVTGDLDQKLGSLLQQSSKLKYEVGELQRQEHMLSTELSAKTLDTQQLEDKHALLKAALDMALDDDHPADFYLEELNKRVEARRHNLVELESKWDIFKHPLEDKKASLEQSLHAQKSKDQEKLLQLNEVEQQIQATSSDILKREEERSILFMKLESQPKTASRNSYIQRITELTKNSRKQDADIDRILQETRKLQIENNSIQERLHRAYTVVDETVFREAKKDSVVGRQAYRLLTSIHESFCQISDTILAIDRARREAVEYEAKLASIASRSFDVHKLQSDIDLIQKENEFLEQQIQHNQSVDSPSPP